LDGERLASGSNGGTVRLWNLSNPAAEPQMLEGHKDRVYSVAFSPDGDWLASGSEDGTVRLWNLIDTESDSIILLNHEASVNSVTFAPDEERLAAASSDQPVRLWNLNDLSAEPEVLPDHGKRVRSVAFAPDGDRLASGSDDGTVRIWSTLSGFSDLFCNLAGRNFTFEEWQQYLLGRDYEKACHQYPVHCSVPLEEWPEELADEQSQCNSQS